MVVKYWHVLCRPWLPRDRSPARLDRTYRDNVRVDDIDETADDNDEITTVRWITEIILERERQ